MGDARACGPRHLQTTSLPQAGRAVTEAALPPAPAFRGLSLDGLEGAYRSVLSGQRICQLYCFMLLFEVLTKPIIAAMTVAGYGVTLVLAQRTGIDPGPMPEIDLLATTRGALDLVTITVVWAVFAIYSSFRPSWPALGLCVFALGYNLYFTWRAFGVADAGLARNVEGVDLNFEVDFLVVLFMTGMVLTHLLFLYIAVRGQRTIHALAAPERRTLSEYRPGAGVWFASMKALVNIPAAIRYSSRKIVTGTLMMVAGVANCVNYWRLFMVAMLVSLTPYLVSLLFPLGGPALRAVWRGEHLAEAARVLGIGLLGMAIAAISLLSIPWFVKIIGRLAIRTARRFMRTSLQKIQHEDTRPPVLFLRSFLNDQVDLPVRGLSLERWLLDGASTGMTLDYLVLAEGTAVGPTVALGNPDDPAPPYGVARGYFTHDTWKDAVARLCADAAAIVLVLDRTEGVKWEIGHIVAHAHAAKTLFLLAPGDVGTAAGEALLSEALDKLTPGRPADAPAPGQGEIVGFRVTAAGEVELMATTRGTYYTYLVAVRRFFRSLADGPVTADERTA